MTLEAIRKHLNKIRDDMKKLKADEKKYMGMEKAAEDAEKLKIIQKSSLSPDELIFFRDMSKEEIELIKERRKREGMNVVQKNDAKD
ncbi:MAG: hypothetical protein IJT63_01600 [Lachnospiraceae bacterium]|nr:hypothetical protein [Lachnospiraceae bacterium]